jgi:hypothetical protein
MPGNLQAVDARRAAVDEVERLLQHPEDLKRLPNMLEEYIQKHQANKVQLSATVASQVDAARSGMELLESAQKTLSKMQQCYNVRTHNPHYCILGWPCCHLQLCYRTLHTPDKISTIASAAFSPVFEVPMTAALAPGVHSSSDISEGVPKALITMRSI